MFSIEWDNENPIIVHKPYPLEQEQRIASSHDEQMEDEPLSKNNIEEALNDDENEDEQSNDDSEVLSENEHLRQEAERAR